MNFRPKKPGGFNEPPPPASLRDNVSARALGNVGSEYKKFN